MKKIIFILILFLIVSCVKLEYEKQYETNPDSMQYSSRVENSIEHEYQKIEDPRSEDIHYDIVKGKTIEEKETEIKNDILVEDETAEKVENIKPKLVILEDASYGDINYVMKDTMLVGKTTIVNVTISESVSNDIIVDKVKSFTNENITTQVIRIAPLMRARLVDPTNENFTIVSISPDEQLVENDDFTKWEWDVTALKEGSNKLKLTVDVIYDSGSKNVEVFEDFIYVYSDRTWWDNFIDFMDENWKWFLSTLMIPFVIYIYKSRKKKNTTILKM